MKKNAGITTFRRYALLRKTNCKSCACGAPKWGSGVSSPGIFLKFLPFWCTFSIEKSLKGGQLSPLPPLSLGPAPDRPICFYRRRESQQGSKGQSPCGGGGGGFGDVAPLAIFRYFLLNYGIRYFIFPRTGVILYMAA